MISPRHTLAHGPDRFISTVREEDGSVQSWACRGCGAPMMFWVTLRGPEAACGKYRTHCWRCHRREAIQLVWSAHDPEGEE